MTFNSFLKNVQFLASFTFSFALFKQKLKFVQQKCQKCPSSIGCWDLNSRPLESPPITTRPGPSPHLRQQNSGLQHFIAKEFIICLESKLLLLSLPLKPIWLLHNPSFKLKIVCFFGHFIFELNLG